jgi:16S rRNA processing protein RimM
MRRVCVAQIGAPHGVRGEVRFRIFTEDPMAIKRYGPLESQDGTRRFEIESLRPAKQMFVARLKGIDDRDAAEQLTNLELFVARDRLPPEDDDDTFYQADLIGLSVYDRQEVEVGTVLAVHNFGAGDLLEVQLRSGRPVMLPFTKAAVPVIDIAAGRMVIDPPVGTFETEAED